MKPLCAFEAPRVGELRLSAAFNGFAERVEYTADMLRRKLRAVFVCQSQRDGAQPCFFGVPTVFDKCFLEPFACRASSLS